MPNPTLQQQLALMQLQSMGLGSTDTSGLMNASMKINPSMALIGAASAIPSLQQNIKQKQLLKELQKEGPQDVTPEAFKQYQGFLQNQANNAQIAGYGSALENINRSQAAGLGNVYKSAINPAQALRGALALNQQSQAAKTQLAIQGAQAQQARQNAANQAMLQRAQYQRQGQQEYDKSVSALRGASAQNWNNFVQGLTGAALNSFVMTPNKKDNVPPGGSTTTTTTTTGTGTGAGTGTGTGTGTGAVTTVNPTVIQTPGEQFTGERFTTPAYKNFINQVAQKNASSYTPEPNKINTVTGSLIPSINPQPAPLQESSTENPNALTGGPRFTGFDGGQVSEQFARSVGSAPAGAQPPTPVVAGTGATNASTSGTGVPNAVELKKSGNFSETPGVPKLVKNKNGFGVYSEAVVRKDQFGDPIIYGTDGKVRKISGVDDDKEEVYDYYVVPEDTKDLKKGTILTPYTSPSISDVIKK